jgi:chromosome segregation ATPase
MTDYLADLAARLQAEASKADDTHADLMREAAESLQETPHCTKKLNALHVNHIALQAENAALQANLRRSEGLCREWAVKAATWMASPEAAQRLDGYRDMGKQIDALEAECEALRKDAERYRWILRNYLSADLTDLALKAGNLDAAIDAAMGKEIGND